jgi:hypothetical protein
MIVAISASLLAIVCAMILFMGMFAAFNVTHEPFAASPAGRPPLQIALADESSAPVADGKPAPFGVRFQLNAPQIPNGPVIVAVPASIDRAAPPNVAAAAAEPAGPQSDATSAPSQGDATVQASPDAPAQTNVASQDRSDQDTKSGDMTTRAAARDAANADDLTATVKAPAESAISERPAGESVQQHVAPEIRIVAREAENPASVSTQPAPTLARKAIKRRKLAVHLHQSHHFRRPRIQATAGSQTSGYMQPNALGQSGFSQPNVNAFAQPSAYAQPSGYAQPGLQLTPAAIKPRPAKLRHAARNGNSASQ